MKPEVRILLWVGFWVVAIVVLLEMVMVTGLPWRVASLEPYLTRYKKDHWTRNAFLIEEIRQASIVEKDTEKLVFLGGSVGLASITSDRQVSGFLSEENIRKVSFYSLCSHYKSFSDELKIIEKLGGVDATVVINTELLRFKTSNDKQLVRIEEDTQYENLKYFYLPTSNVAREILEEFGLEVDMKQRTSSIRSAIVLGEIFKKQFAAFLNTRKFLTNQSARHFTGLEPLTIENTEKHKKILDDLLEKTKKLIPINKRLLEAVIRQAQSNGNRVVLLDSPINPLFKDQISNMEKGYDTMIASMVYDMNLGYIDMRKGVEWISEDFRDLHHMLPSGREKFTRVLAKRLAQLQW